MDDLRVVTIDGPAGSGKSTVAGKLAKRLGFVHLNSGALYRVLGFEARKRGVPFEDEERVTQVARELSFEFDVDQSGETHLSVDGEDLSRQIASQEVGEWASRVALLGALREVICDVLREVAGKQSVVVEGRDAGTVIFPEAHFKFYLDASLEERARRRLHQLGATCGETIDDVQSELAARDHRDRTREIAPQRKADDAILIDTTALDADRVVEKIYELITGGQTRV